MILDKIKLIAKSEPAVLLGVFGALITYVIDALVNSTSDVTSWAVALPIVVSAVIRFFVTSPATVEKRVAAAKTTAKAAAAKKKTAPKKKVQGAS